MSKYSSVLVSTRWYSLVSIVLIRIRWHSFVFVSTGHLQSIFVSAGSPAVALRVDGGIVDVAPWRDHARSAQCMEAFVLPPETVAVPVHALLQASFRQSAFPSLFEQVFCQVAAMVDTTIQAKCVDSADTAAKVLDGHWRRVQGELLRYQKAGLAAMEGKKYLSIAPDASKIGKRTYLLCPLVDAESGLAMWCAPQILPFQMGWVLVAQILGKLKSTMWFRISKISKLREIGFSSQ